MSFFTPGPRFGWYFDRQGAQISVERWGELYEDPDYKRVALDTYPSLEEVASGEHPLSGEPVATVSTVWLGINHGFGDRRPVIFETMIFGGGAFDGEGIRYHTESDALEGHWRVMEDLRAGRGPWFLVSEMETDDAE